MALKHNYLNEVIFRIDFTTILELSGDKKDAVKEFKDDIFEFFPIVEILEGKKFKLDIDVESGYPQKLTNEGNFCWVFKNEEYNKQVSLTANNLILSYGPDAYEIFPNFLNEINLLINTLKKVYEPFKINFLGLRYINEINDKEINENIEQYINPTLFNNNLLHDLKKENNQFIQLFSTLNYKFEEFLLTFQYGFYNPTDDPEHDKHFILDYDCVTESVTDIENIPKNLKLMNELIFTKFEYSISDLLINKMGDDYGSSN